MTVRLSWGEVRELGSSCGSAACGLWRIIGGKREGVDGQRAGGLQHWSVGVTGAKVRFSGRVTALGGGAREDARTSARPS